MLILVKIRSNNNHCSPNFMKNHKGMIGLFLLFHFVLINPSFYAYARSPDSNWIAPDEVRLKLAENGISKIQSITASETGWTVKARLGDKSFVLYIDPFSGQITDKNYDMDTDDIDISTNIGNSASKCNKITGKNCVSPLDNASDQCTIFTGKRCDPKGESIFGFQGRRY